MHVEAKPEQRRELSSLVLLAAGIAVVLAALHFAAPVVSPTLLALVLALILWPVYRWLKQRGLGTLPALLILVTGVVVGVGVIALIVLYSASGMAGRVAVYSDQLSAELASLDAWFASHGLNETHLRDQLPADQIAGAFRMLLSGLLDAVSQAFVVLLLLLFFLVEGPALTDRLRLSLSEHDPNTARMATFAHEVAQYFALRAAVNAITGAGVTLVLWLLGVDFPLLWGVLTFFLSFIPYIGMFLASVPSVLLAWAEYGLAHAVLVAIALTIVNAAAENLVQPALMHKGLHLSPTFVFISVFFWGWLIGGGGSFLAIPISLGLLMVLANFPGAQWFVGLVSTRADAPAATVVAAPAAAPADPRR